MTTITLPRATAQQALEALKVAVDHYHTYHGHPGTKFQQAIDDLRAALAQQKDPTDPGNDVDVLREHVRHLERRVRQLHAQQAEPVAGVVLNEEGRAALVEHGREEWHCVSRNARRLYIAPPQRKPLPKHDQHCVDVPGYGLMAVRLVRAVERAHGIKE